MKKSFLKLAEECFDDASITDELCSASIKKYRNSIKRFAAVIDDKSLEELSNSDFDQFIIRMKEKNACNARIANIISSVKWVISRLKEKGLVFNQLNLLTIKKPRIMKKETNYLTEKEIEQFINCHQGRYG